MSTKETRSQERNATQITVREAVEGAEILDEDECDCENLNNVETSTELECWHCYRQN